MTYSSLIPQPNDIPADGTNDYFNNFNLANIDFNMDHVPFAGVLANILNTNPATVVSTMHTLFTGNTVTFQGLNDNPLDGFVTGMGALDGNTYTITVVDANTFTLNGVDATNTAVFIPYDLTKLYGSYTSAQLNSGFHKKITYDGNAGDPNLLPPISSVYPKETNLLYQLYFQNGMGSALVEQLTNSTAVPTPNGNGFRTPWGLIINMGFVNFNYPGISFEFPIHFTSAATVYTLLATPLFSPKKNQVVSWGAEATSGSTFTGAGFITSSPVGTPVPMYYFAMGI
jgi:hypothetical protein